jgi:hypothetical protein
MNTAHSLQKGEYKDGSLIAMFVYHNVPKAQENITQNKMTNTAFFRKGH